MMVEWLDLTTVLVGVVVFFGSYVLIQSHRGKKGQRLPPGPPGWPLLGHLPSMARDAHLQLTAWRHQYGDVYSIRIGLKKVVVINGYETIREALVRKADQFSSRPHLFLTDCTNGPEGMFTRGFSEANQQKVPIQEIDAGCMEEILKYAYSGAVQVNKTNVRELYLASDLLQVEHVQNTCVQFMVNQVDINTCVASYQFAQAYGIPELLQAAKACICRKFLKLSQTQELLELPLSELKDILSSDDLDIKNELVVLQTVESWVNYNREERMAQLEDLAQVVRFNLISPSKIPELFSHLEVVKCARVARHSKKGSTPSRLGMDAKEMIVFFGSDFPYGSMYTSSDDADDVQCSGEEKWTVGAYDPGTKTLYKVSDSGNSCPSAVAVVPEESVWYAIYHSDPVSHTLLDNDQQRFMMYDAVNNQWIDKCPPLFKHTSRCSLDCVNSKIYLIGDTDDADGQNMSWFDPMWNQWTAVAAFPEHLGYNFHTASIDQYIYLITSDVFYRFDTTTDQWRKLSTGTKNDKRIIGVWAHEGKFFCIYEYHDVYVYSPEWHSWHLEEPKGIRMPLVQQLLANCMQLPQKT